MFGDVVLGIPHEAFEDQLEGLKNKVGVTDDTELSAEQLEELCSLYLKVYEAYKQEFPQDARAQLRACIKAVFGSWNSERAIKYREIHQITNLLGTACNIQTMVFGNLGTGSGTGVAFSRDPGTGQRALKGEYLVNAQGEDVVAGKWTMSIPAACMVATRQVIAKTNMYFCFCMTFSQVFAHPNI